LADTRHASEGGEYLLLCDWIVGTIRLIGGENDGLYEDLNEEGDDGVDGGGAMTQLSVYPILEIKLAINELYTMNNMDIGQK